MSNIVDVIGWKFNHQEGMCCKEINGLMTITAFPSGIPSQQEQDAWTAEYDAWQASGGEKDIQVDNEFDGPMQSLIETLVPMIQDGSISSMTGADVLAAVKANRKAEL